MLRISVLAKTNNFSYKFDTGATVWGVSASVTGNWSGTGTQVPVVTEQWMSNIPDTQRAVQLVGENELVLNTRKKVARPGRHQILCRVEAMGLCFSDLKLLRQFSGHVRKGHIVSGIEQEILGQIPSYVPGKLPTVPGHEAVVRIEAVGPGVDSVGCGGRYLVQTDYRWLPTESSNAAFGYNFEGALQEYVLMDERVITSPEGELLLIPVSRELSASAVALVEPMACVENAYTSKERRGLQEGGRLAAVSDVEPRAGSFGHLFGRYGRPSQVTLVSKFEAPSAFACEVNRCARVSELVDAGYDDVIYFGADAEKVEALFAKVAAGGLFNIVLGGSKFRREVVTMVGRVHYGGIRIIGTPGHEPTDSMEYIPQTGEIRAGDKVHIIGAGGPMGMMHVVRDICQGLEGISILAGDVDEARLDVLSKISAPLAAKNGVEFKAYNPARRKTTETFDYTVVMVPLAELVGESVHITAKGGIINIFAGIPATAAAGIDLDCYIEKQLYFVGTSGSVLDDMKRVLAKVESGRLDTNMCVAAVCGLDGAAEGIRAVEERRIAGKIIVYPACKGLGLTRLEELDSRIPSVAACLRAGQWNKQAEKALLKRWRD